MRIKINRDITLIGASSKSKQTFKDMLTIANPKWLENDRMGRWNHNTPKTLEYYIDHKKGLSIPRGLLDDVLKQYPDAAIKDSRQLLKEINFKFIGKLRDYQQIAINQMLASDYGVLQSPTGGGKTVMALNIIYIRKQPTLILVHTKDLLEQWKERIKTFLGIPEEEIGVFGDGKKILGKQISIGMVQTIYKCAEQIAPHIGHLIIDESHRVPSRLFSEAVTEFNCKYILGLSATPYRRDGLTKLIHWFVGPCLHEISIKEMQDLKAITHIDIIFKPTEFKSAFDASDEYSKVIRELTENEHRNKQIAFDAVKESKNGVVLILSDRKKHCHDLEEIINDKGYQCEVLTGSVKTKDRKKIIKLMNDGKVQIVCATGQLIGEGFDCKVLHTLLLATPIKYNGRLIQYMGRVLRPMKGKDKAKLIDYVDSNIVQLRASAKMRSKTYSKEFGYDGDFF